MNVKLTSWNYLEFEFICAYSWFSEKPPPAATQSAARLLTARVASSSFSSLFLMWSWHPKCERAMHLAFPPSHCKLVLSYIPTHNNPVGLSLETWLANGGTATSDPSPRETIDQEICNSTWKMRSSVMLEMHTTSFIQRQSYKSWGNSSCRNLRLRLSCKTFFLDE